MNIAQSSFRDVFNAIMTERDLSEPKMREMYEGRMSNKRNNPLQESDSLQVQAILQVEDCYEDI